MTDREGDDPENDDHESDRDDSGDPADSSPLSDPFTHSDETDAADEEPFERMETTDDVDAFDDLGDPPDERRDASTDRGEATSGPLGATAASEAANDGIDPFAELDVSPDPDAAPGSVEDPFERMAVESVDMDEVWDALDDDTDLPPAASEAAPGPDTRSDDVVDKRTYCQRCPHFTEPPETACLRDGTDIVEVIGFGEFRVRGCPMVSEDGPGFDRSR